MKKISKNCYLGEEITDMRQLVDLSKERKSIAFNLGTHTFIRPAAFVIHWSVAMISRFKIYHVINISNINKSE
jgi:hypothetical protein